MFFTVFSSIDLKGMAKWKNKKGQLKGNDEGEKVREKIFDWIVQRP